MKLRDQIKPNLTGIIFEWFPFKIVSDSPAYYLRWLLLLKIEISLNQVDKCFQL